MLYDSILYYILRQILKKFKKHAILKSFYLKKELLKDTKMPQLLETPIKRSFKRRNWRSYWHTNRCVRTHKFGDEFTQAQYNRQIWYHWKSYVKSKSNEENENRLLLAKENTGLKQNIEELPLAYLALSEGCYKILGKGQSNKKDEISCVHTYTICSETSAHLYGEEQSF